MASYWINLCIGHITILLAMCKKTNKSLNFIHWNLSKCHQDVKISAYLTIVCPLLEYTACTRDPHQEYLIYEIEKLQRRATRWALSDYNCYSSMTEMLNLLGWPTLESRRYNSRLTQLYKIMHHHTLPYINCHTICLHNIQQDTSTRTTLYYQLYPLLPISKAFSSDYQSMEQFTQ